MTEKLHSGDWDPAEWMTAREAAETLGCVRQTVKSICVRLGIDMIRVPLNATQTRWLLRHDQVEDLARKRQVALEEKAKSKAGRAGKAKSPWGTREHSESLPGSVWDYVGIGERAKPNNSLKYACMTVGFAHRPIPVGSTKRKAYCSICTASRCVHHPEMTPREVRKLKRMPTRYPEISMAWAVYGERGSVNREEVREELESLAGMSAASGVGGAPGR